MLNELAKEIYDNACEKGWHDKPVAFGDAITNIHGELSEAWEEYRNRKELNEEYYECTAKNPFIDCKDIESNCAISDKHGVFCISKDQCQYKKPCGVPSEFADTIIRVLDNCHMYGIDIDEAVRSKIEYNKHREYKHGGKII